MLQFTYQPETITARRESFGTSANSFNLLHERGLSAHLQHPSRGSVVKTVRLSENKCLNSEIPFCWLRTAGAHGDKPFTIRRLQPTAMPGGAPSPHPPGPAKAGHRMLGKPNRWTSKPMSRTWRVARFVAPGLSDMSVQEISEARQQSSGRVRDDGLGGSCLPRRAPGFEPVNWIARRRESEVCQV